MLFLPRFLLLFSLLQNFFLFQGSPGKLKLNLNINVNALRPGLRPPKIGLLPKSHSLELPNPDKEYDNESTTNYSSTNILNAKSIDQNSTFEANEENVKVLHSITKVSSSLYYVQNSHFLSLLRGLKKKYSIKIFKKLITVTDRLSVVRHGNI